MTTTQTAFNWRNSIRIECSCRYCKAVATMEGLTLPLLAAVPATAQWKATIRTAAGRHNVVFAAHDPASSGVAFRATTGITAIVRDERAWTPTPYAARKV